MAPCRAGDAVAGDSAKVSRSLRRAEDCLSAELKREFCNLVVSVGYRRYRERAGLTMARKAEGVKAASKQLQMSSCDSRILDMQPE